MLIQDQASSQAFEMPSNAISTGCVDFVFPLDRISSALITLITLITLVMVQGAADLFEVPMPSWAYLQG